jgi:hypothetical protein
MTEAILGLQSVVVGLIATGAAIAKLTDRTPARTVTRTALARLIRGRRSLLVLWYGLAGAELVAGLLACSRTAGRWSALPVGTLMAGALAYSSWALYAAPDASCGCLGHVSSDKVTRVGLARTTILLALAALGASSPATWNGMTKRDVVLIVVTGIAELTLAMGLFPEIRSHFRPRPEPCETRQEPIAQTLARLRAGKLWGAVAQHLEAPEPSDSWRQACWRYITFPATYRGDPAIAVFVVRIAGTARSDAVAFVHRDDDRVLGRLTTETLREPWAISHC